MTGVVWNRNPKQDNNHFQLYAGHLGSLSGTDMFRYLSLEHEPTLMGFLLGIAAAKRCAVYIGKEPKSFCSYVPLVLNLNMNLLPAGAQWMRQRTKL